MQLAVLVPERIYWYLVLGTGVGCAVPVLGVRGFIAAAEACGTLYPLSSLLFPIYLKVRFKSLVHFSTLTLPGGSMWKNKVFDWIVLE